MNYINVPGLLSVPDAARELGRSAKTLRRLIKAGKIPAQKIGAHFLVDVDQVLQATKYTGRPSRPVDDPQSRESLEASRAAVRSAAVAKIDELRNAGAVPECGLCHHPIAAKGVMLSELFDEHDKKTYFDDPWFACDSCVYRDGWKAHKAKGGMIYETTSLDKLTAAPIADAA